MKIKKNLVLANKKNNEMALLTLEKLSSGVLATLKTFNINEQEVAVCLAENNKDIFTEKVKLHNNSCQFNLSGQVNLDNCINCVIAKVNNNAYEPIVWDKDSENSYKNYVCNVLSQNLKQTETTQTSKVINLDEMFDIQNPAEIEELIDEHLEDLKVSSETNFFNLETEKIKQKLKEGEIFFDLISDQINDLFNKYPAEEKLEQLIPNSKWVKVKYSEDSNEYVLGLIYDDINLKYICYGVPGSFDQNPPKELENFSQWLPLNPDNVSEGGYWVMYQDAINGENIQIDYV